MAVRRQTMSAKKLGVYRRNWRPKTRKRWIGTVVVAAVAPNRRRQVWIT